MTQEMLQPNAMLTALHTLHSQVVIITLPSDLTLLEGIELVDMSIWAETVPTEC